MSITIHLAPEEERSLQERAARSGEDVADFIRRVLDRHLKAADALAAARRQFAESGMSEADLDTLVEEAREDVWREGHGRPPRSS